MLSRVCNKTLVAKSVMAVRFAGTAAAAPAAGKPAEGAKPAAPAAAKPAPPPPRPGPPKLEESPMDYPQVIEHNAQTGSFREVFIICSSAYAFQICCSSYSREGGEN